MSEWTAEREAEWKWDLDNRADTGILAPMEKDFRACIAELERVREELGVVRAELAQARAGLAAEKAAADEHYHELRTPGVEREPPGSCWDQPWPRGRFTSQGDR